MTFTVRPLEVTFGAEVDVDLSGELDQHTVARLRSALLQHKVLAFPDQHLSPEALEAFTRHLGEPFRRDGGYAGPKTFDGNPVVGSIGPTPPGRRPTSWHIGSTWQERPLAFELLTIVVTPPTGGATLFGDLQAAYERLSPAMQVMVSTLRAAHSTQVMPTGRGGDSPDTFDAGAHVEHPIVVTHPETGRRGLYLSSRITHLLGIPREEGAAVLSFLRAHAAAAEHQLRYRWRAGDLVVWDNRSVWHRAVDDYGDAERWGYKTAVLGDWRPA